MEVAAARANTTAIVSSTESGSTESEAEPKSDCTAGDEAGLKMEGEGRCFSLSAARRAQCTLSV